ncbi:unnamed protein product [Ectocarpus sp. 12 AP-2014]
MHCHQPCAPTAKATEQQKKRMCRERTYVHSRTKILQSKPRQQAYLVSCHIARKKNKEKKQRHFVGACRSRHPISTHNRVNHPDKSLKADAYGEQRILESVIRQGEQCPPTRHHYDAGGSVSHPVKTGTESTPV